MPPTNAPRPRLAPVLFASHGSPWMCCKESASSEWWAKFGQEAFAGGIKGVVFIGAHWEELGDRIRIATKFDPAKVQMDMVPRAYWEKYPINVSEELAGTVMDLLREHQFTDVEADPTFDWHDDTITPARWLFPEGTPPSTVVSLNARYNPVFHVRIGRALSKLREAGILIIGTGGAIGSTPAKWATDFEWAGPALPGALVRLTQSPGYKAAHPTDDHFFPLLVAAGAASDGAEQGRLMAQTWELQHMCNNQFAWGSWESSPSVPVAM
ncbi:aromatic ring-opening dioxygenase [Thozetella sp. PMI_491]|nr:aromatic ring-opening dioxygenase [Thozetella sp. PMI_491]